DGATPLATNTLSSGSATLSTTLSTTSHSITAVYNSDGNYNASTSSALTQTVNKANSATAVVSSQNPSVFGQSVTFTATVTATAPGSGTPTGNVVFKDGATALATTNLSGGSATYTTAALSVTNHSITVAYTGDTSFNTTTSGAVTQSVGQASSATALASAPNPSVFGQSVTFTATVSVVPPGSGTPSGTVTFKDGTNTLGTGTLSSGQA